MMHDGIRYYDFEFDRNTKLHGVLSPLFSQVKVHHEEECS